MIKEELQIICEVHKATALSELEPNQLHLYTDGTTKIKKL